MGPPGKATDVVSPELALVCPELAAAARAALPDRPWEVFAPPRPPPRLRLVSSPPAATPPVAPPVPTRPGRASARPGLGAALGLLTVVALVATGLLPARDAPTLRDAPPRPRAPALPPSPSVLPGAYEVSGGGTLFVAGTGAGGTISGFAPPNRCLPDGATVQAPIAADGSFGVVFAAGPAAIEFAGRVDGGRISGSYRVRRPGCVTRRVYFTAGAPPTRATPARSRHD
jgi:hypothetical protein